MFGEDHSEARRLRCLAFVGFLTSEQGAVGLLSRVKDFLGLRGDVFMRCEGENGAHYTQRERADRSTEMGRAID